MSRLPIVEAVLKYMKEENIPFAMPGHKSGRGFLYNEEGRSIINNLSKSDITEVEGLDNLHQPEGVIKEAQDLLKSVYGSEKSYFLVNGSTSGNLSMIFSSFNEGDTVLVERNCHRSIFNGIIMRKLKPVYIRNIVSRSYNVPLSLDTEHFLQLLREVQDIKGVIITYPNYYGICSDLKLIIKESKKRSIKVLVDSAHGAHFGVNELLPESAVALGADMVVMSAHKTLPCLTQAAYLHVNKGVGLDKIDFYVSAFTSTSPSYLLLAALDYARFYLQHEAAEGFRSCIEMADKYRALINGLDGFHVISEEDIHKYDKSLKIDRSRLVVNVGKVNNGHLLLKYLRTNKIQVEMSDGNNIILILSPFNVEEDLYKLYQALANYNIKDINYINEAFNYKKTPNAVLLPHEVMERKKECIGVSQALGRIAAENLVPYPPGIPIIMMGEYIDEDTINTIQDYINIGANILGVEDGKIQVIRI